jgi:hypothetical protein
MECPVFLGNPNEGAKLMAEEGEVNSFLNLIPSTYPGRAKNCDREDMNHKSSGLTILESINKGGGEEVNEGVMGGLDLSIGQDVITGHVINGPNMNKFFRKGLEVGDLSLRAVDAQDTDADESMGLMSRGTRTMGMDYIVSPPCAKIAESTLPIHAAIKKAGGRSGSKGVGAREG